MRVITIEKLKKWMDENKILVKMKYKDDDEERWEHIYRYPDLFKFVDSNMQDIEEAEKKSCINCGNPLMPGCFGGPKQGNHCCNLWNPKRINLI